MDLTTDLGTTTTNRRVSRRTLGLLAAAAATATLGVAAVTTASGANGAPIDDPTPRTFPAETVEPFTAPVDAEASLFERGSEAVRNVFVDDDFDGNWEDCPACGMG